MNGSFFVSPIEAIFYSCLLCCGPLTAGLCILMTYLLNVAKDGNKYWHLLNMSKRYLILNFTHHLIIMLILHRLYLLLLALPFNLTILPAILLAPFPFTLSCFVNALFYKIEEEESFRENFRDMFSPYYQTAFPASLAAVIIAMAYPRYGLFSLFFMVTPLVVTLFTMKSQARGKS